MIDLPPDAALIANTPRLRLVPVTPEDAEEMFVLLNDQRLHRHVGGLPPAETELTERYRSLESRRSADGREVYLTWIVRLVPLGEAVGEIRATVTADGLAVIGFTIGQRYQRHGFATEALRAMVRLLEAHLHVVTLEALVPPRHRAAQTVAARLGMEHDGNAPTGWHRWRGLTSAALELAAAVPPPRVRVARAPRPRRRSAPGAVVTSPAPPPHKDRRRT